MGHRAIHPNLCLASRNTFSRSTLGDLEKITEQLEWWAPPYFLFACRFDSCGQTRFLVSYRPLAPSLGRAHARSEPLRMQTAMGDQ